MKTTTNSALRCLLAICVLTLCLVLPMQAQRKFYTLKGNGVNVRTAPFSGSVAGKISAPYSFFGEEKDGWVEFYFEGNSDRYVSRSLVEEVELTHFSRKHFGRYMGESDVYTDGGYAAANLEEKDGYVLLHLTAFSYMQDDGMRMQMSFVFAGKPEKDGVLFSHEIYPYHSDIPVADQLTPEGERPYFKLLAGKDGNLYSDEPSFLSLSLEPQQTNTEAEDVKLTERSLFMLKGNVKSIHHMRSYPKSFFESYDSPPFANFAHVYNFTEEGDLANISVYDSQINKTAEYDFKRQGNQVKVSGTYGPLQVSADYVRDISNFDISYEGSWKRSDGSESSIGNSYVFDLQGRCTRQYFSITAPPFISHEEGEENEVEFRYDATATLPGGMDMEYHYGGGSWLLQGTLKDVKTDRNGNWTEYKLFDVDGNLLFMEMRKIFYYGNATADNAGTSAASDNAIYETVSQPAEFPGGNAALMSFIARNLKYPLLCQENGIQGKVVLKFVVEKDGSIGEIKTVSSPDRLLEKEALRVVRLLPRWKAGKQYGNAVRTWVTVPVTFKLS